MNTLYNKLVLSIVILLFWQANAQTTALKKLGYKTISTQYKSETCQIIIRTKQGEETKEKPLLLYFQGSLARPLFINYPEHQNYVYDMAFPFETDSLLEKYHIAVIAKPFIPVVANINDLDGSYSYLDSVTGKNPKLYLQHNSLDYMAKRNAFVIDFLRKQKYVNKKRMIVLGHSEGARIAYETTKYNHHISALILLSGNPYGRYMNIVQQNRNSEKDSTFAKTDNAFTFWKTIQQNKNVHNFEDGGDTYASWYAYSKPYANELLALELPVFVGYGTKDDGAPYFDLFQFENSFQKNSNIKVKSYPGLDHSFYRVFEDGQTDHEKPYFTNVVIDALETLGRS